MAEHTSYLNRITFDPNLKNSWVGKYIVNVRIVLLLVLTVVFLGLVSFFNLPRRLNPEIKIPIVTIFTVLPGASPEDVESLVTIPLENQLRGLTGIDVITSSSQDNVSVISMQFFSTVSQEKAKNDVQSAVDSVNNLPTETQTPKVTALDFENQPIWTFALKSKTDDTPSLMRFARQLQQKIDDEPKVGEVTVRGFETQEIVVHISTLKIQQYNINPLQLSQAVKTALAAFPAGSVTTGNNTFSLTIDPSITKVADLRKVRLNIGDQIVQLGDVAEVSERSKPSQLGAYLANTNNSSARIVTFNVFKISSAKIDETATKVEKIVTEELKTQNDRFEMVTISSSAEEVSKQFTDLLGEFRSTMLLVFACLFVFLGLRQAIISVFTVPLTFLSAFIFMQVLGMSINFLSLFAFLLALGLLIDDTIVVVSAMTSYYKSGKFSPPETGLLVWRDTIVPIWSTTITTIWSFVPLLLTSGIIGEFIKPIPVVVTVTMISSTAIAVLVTLPFMIVLLKPQFAYRVIVLAKVIAFTAGLALLVALIGFQPVFLTVAVVYIGFALLLRRHGKTIASELRAHFGRLPLISQVGSLLSHYSNHGVVNIEGLSERYYRFISRILNSKSARRRVIIAIVTYSVVGFLLIPVGLVQNEFFPKTDAQQLYVEVELPPGTSVDQTKTHSFAILDEVRQVPNVEFVILEIGRTMDSFGGSGTDSVNTAQLTLHLPEKHLRHQSSIEIAEQLRSRFKQYSSAKVTVTEQSGGPPAGNDLQVKLLGPDLGQLNIQVDKIVGYLQAQPGVISPEKSIKPGTSAILFVPDADKLAQQGLTRDAVGIWLRSYASGLKLEDVTFDETTNEQQDITLRFTKDIPRMEELGSIVIPTSSGGVPLLSLGTLTLKPNPTIITRENGERSISVSAGVRPGYSISQKNQELVKFTKGMSLPVGYSWQTGGVNEENAKSVQSILQAMIVAFILILVTMVIQFQSYRQAIIVLLVIPLAVSSVFYFFGLTGTPLSFPALIGVLSLFGIVVTNSMFIVDKINLNLKQGMEFTDSIADAGASRMEPIILTKLCTVLGLLPITLADPLWRGLGGAIISGLLLSSTIMLLFIPVVYYSWFKPKEIAN